MILKLLIASIAIVSGNPKEVLKKIEQQRAAAIRVAKEAKRTPDYTEINRQNREVALEAVKGVDPRTVEPGAAYSWARLFQMAGLHDESILAADRAEGPDAFAASALAIDGELLQGRKGAVAARILKLKPTTIDQQLSLGSRLYAYADPIKEGSGTAEAVRVLGEVLARPPVEDFKVAAERRIEELNAAPSNSDSAATTPLSAMDFQKRLQQSFDATRLDLIQKQCELLEADGKKDEAIEVLKAFRAGLPEGSALIRGLDGSIRAKSLPGQPAPAFTFTETIGEYKGLESLKGKVVLLDFFAHWCGPCKAAFPDMRQTLADLGPKGLAIVGITRYQGYYGTENYTAKDMPKETEFKKMEAFVKEHSMTWPVAFTDRAPFDAYGVTGIPHLVVIDRTGNVRQIKIGYSKEGFAKFRAELEKMLAE